MSLPLSDSKIQHIQKLASEGRSAREIASLAGVGVASAVKYAKVRVDCGPEYTVELTADIETPEQILERAEEQRAANIAHAIESKKRSIHFSHSRPIIFYIGGDPHLDDNYTDIREVFQHATFVQNDEDTLGALIGDILNNWTGRLMAKYANQETTRDAGLTLAELLFQRLGRKCIANVLGNHDHWHFTSGHLSRLASLHKAFAAGDSVDITFEWKNGQRIRTYLAHQFPGKSMYNPAHGAANRTGRFRFPSHQLVVGGHIHQSGHQMVKIEDVEGKANFVHGVQLASYEKHSTYAEEKQFADNKASSAAWIVLDPSKDRDDPHQVTHFYDYLAAWRYREGLKLDLAA